MYRVYYTYPPNNIPSALDIENLTIALNYCQDLREQGMVYVTLVSDYADMCGKPGVKGAGSEYVPQMLNP